MIITTLYHFFDKITGLLIAYHTYSYAKQRKAVKITVNNLDNANILVSATFPKSDIDTKVNALATKAGKQMKVDGFRKGKVPVHIVKKMHGEQLIQDAEGEAIREVIDQAFSESGVSASDMLGDPIFKKYDRTEDGVEAEIQLCLKPKVDLSDYQSVIPAFDEPTISTQETHEKMVELARQSAPLESIQEKRTLASGDTAVFDFEGFLDGEPFEGGKADDFELEIGSNQFVAGFEDQMIGMNIDEAKRIKLTFPKDYQAENLKGKDTEFDVKLKDIKTKTDPELDDELAKKIVGSDDATIDTLKDRTTEQIKTEKISKLYSDELKPKLLEVLVAKYDFDLPENIIEQEIDNLINGKAQNMTEDEIKEIQADTAKLEALRDESRQYAIDSVKATFIVDALAKAEKVSIDDQEVHQALYYEAMMAGQKPEDVLEHYKKNNLIPAIKMGMLEDKLFGKLFGLDK